MSEEIVEHLVGLEERSWSEWKHGRSLTTSQLAALLKPLGIRPKGFRVGDKTPRGYARSQFEDSFARYLPPEAQPLQQGGNNGRNETPSERNAIDEAAAQKNQGNGENSPLRHARRYDDMTVEELTHLGMSGGSFGPLVNRLIKDPK